MATVWFPDYRNTSLHSIFWYQKFRRNIFSKHIHERYAMVFIFPTQCIQQTSREQKHPDNKPTSYTQHKIIYSHRLRLAILNLKECRYTIYKDNGKLTVFCNIRLCFYVEIRETKLYCKKKKFRLNGDFQVYLLPSCNLSFISCIKLWMLLLF